MKLHLNGWQRIGVIVSILWFFIGGFWGNDLAIHEGTDWVVSSYGTCLKLSDDTSLKHAPTWDQCKATFDKDFAAGVKGHWWGALFFAVVPIILGWSLAYGFIALFRWVRRGFLTIV